jgi:hypothetical protein
VVAKPRHAGADLGHHLVRELRADTRLGEEPDDPGPLDVAARPGEQPVEGRSQPLGGVDLGAARAQVGVERRQRLLEEGARRRCSEFGRCVR